LWPAPPARDRIVGVQFRTFEDRDTSAGADALRSGLPKIFSATSEPVLLAAVQAAQNLGLRDGADVLRQLVLNTNQPARARVEAIKTLIAFKDSQVLDVVKIALRDNDSAVRNQALAAQALLQPSDAIDQLAVTLEKGSLSEQQGAFDTFATIKDPKAEGILMIWMQRLVDGKVPPEIQLNLYEAARAQNSAKLAELIARFETAMAPQKLGIFRLSLAGGDAEEGKKVFLEKPEASCVRCHKIRGEGGDVGPELTGVGARGARDYILESIIKPNEQIAQGFENVIVTLKNGTSYAGPVKKETETELVLNSPEDGLITVAKADIRSRERGLSGMPEALGEVLTKRDLRNLVEFLSTVK
jgi:quinoprotein glucose dehydrogenase